MLEWVGISKEQAQGLFEFEAVSNVFPGSVKNRGHLRPTEEEMTKHWQTTLCRKVEEASGIWIMGRVASKFFYGQFKSSPPSYFGHNVIETIHPSRRNYSKIMAQKELITSLIKNLAK